MRLRKLEDVGEVDAGSCGGARSRERFATPLMLGQD